jgi:hypothetical protein
VWLSEAQAEHAAAVLALASEGWPVDVMARHLSLTVRDVANVIYHYILMKSH